RRAVAEAEALTEDERVRAATVGDDNSGCDLRDEPRTPVRPVVELRGGRILEPPAGRDVAQLRVDLDRRTAHAHSEDPGGRRLGTGKPGGGQERRACRQQPCREPQSSWHRLLRRREEAPG